MKQLFLISLLFMFSCKKKNSTPNVSNAETTTVPTNTCVTLPKLFSGKFSYVYDTITITFLKNNCPINNNNLYLLHNFNSFLNHINLETPKRVLPAMDYTLSTDEGSNPAISGTFAVTTGTSNIYLNAFQLSKGVYSIYYVNDHLSAYTQGTLSFNIVN